MGDRGFFDTSGGDSQNNNAGAKKVIRPVRALMISQVLNATLENDDADGHVVIDSNPAGNVVLCAELLEAGEKKLRLGDATGTIDLRIPSYGTDGTVYESQINSYCNLFGHFRVFQGKPQFDFSHLEFNIHPYQFLYHEVEAAREVYHYKDFVKLGQSLSEVNGKSEQPETKQEESIFVNSGEDEDLKERILGIIQGFEDTGDGVTTDYIASELSLDEGVLRGILSKLESDAKVYEIDNYWRAN